MTVDMEKEILYLKNIFKETGVVVSVGAPPKYLLPFISESQIIFVYKRVSLGVAFSCS